MAGQSFSQEKWVPGQALVPTGVALSYPQLALRLHRVIHSRAVGFSPMPEKEHLPGQLRFGVFEVDLRAGELRKHGLRVRLQEQPFQVLAMLLEHLNEVVTREELQKKLWPADTFVDFDHGLNKAINKIREALGDSAESPRFVETVSRRGYRFLAEVRVVDSPPLRGPEFANPAQAKDRPDVSGESVAHRRFLAWG